MDIITVDGKKYDPYFILDVTKDDTSDRITKSFREKVKRYHPDKYTDPVKKKKYEKYFKILTESYQYIKQKREQLKQLTRKGRNATEDTVKKNMTKDNLKVFNETFKTDDPNGYGYGENYSRMEDVNEYDKFNVNVVNQFGDKKFSNERFNNIFDYNKALEDDEYDKRVNMSLVHKTTDGFHGYNSSDFGNCALVSSYNGLMITGDNFGERGVGYWGNGYSDYKYSYKGVKNPNSKIVVPKHCKKNTTITKVTPTEIQQYKHNYNKIDKDSMCKPIKNIDKMIYDELVDKEKQDEILVKTYISQYDKTTVEKALLGELPQSQTYKAVLQKYISN
jgi:curved DNA-binding protein CbpA